MAVINFQDWQGADLSNFYFIVHLVSSVGDQPDASDAIFYEAHANSNFHDRF